MIAMSVAALLESSRKAYAADLDGMSDDDIRREIEEVEDRINEDTDWLDALTAEREFRAHTMKGEA